MEKIREREMKFSQNTNDFFLLNLTRKSTFSEAYSILIYVNDGEK